MKFIQQPIAKAFASATLAALALCAMPAHAATEVTTSTGAVATDTKLPLTRERVREELKSWKAAGMKSMDGDITDTPQVLAARQTFYELQTEVLQTEATQAAQRAATPVPLS